MSNHDHLSEPDPRQPDRPNDELYIARMALVETINSHTQTLLRHAHPLIKIGAELIAIDREPPFPTGDLSTLPPGLREFVQKSLQEEEQEINGTPPPYTLN